MSRALSILALALLSGCQSFTEAARRHPCVTGFVVTSLAISGAKALDHDGTHERRVTTQPVNCNGGVSCQ